jgi:hypothetical protein
VRWAAARHLSRVFLLQLGEDRYDIGLVINPSMPADRS